MPESKNTTAATNQRHTFILMLGTLASRITGLLRTALLLQRFPVEITDAFLVAWKIPNLFRELLAEGALTNSFVPVYAGLPAAEGKKLVGALTAILALVNSVLLLGTFFAAPWLVNLMLVEGTTVNIDLAVQLTRLIFPVLAAISFAALAMGILNAEEHFFAPAWAPVALNVVMIMAMLFFPARANILALSVVLGGIMQLAIQLPALHHYRLLPTALQWYHSHLSDVLLLMAPFALTTGARQVLNVVATYQLSSLPAGSVTAYDNANLLVSLALGLFSVSPALVFYSRLSKIAQPEQQQEFTQTLREGLEFIAFLTAPIGLLLMVCAAPAVNTIWGFRPASGQFATLYFTVNTAIPLGLAVFPLGLNNLLLRPFYIRKKVRTVIIISLSFIILTAVLYIILTPIFGIAGLSVSTVIVNWLQLALLLAWMWRWEGLELQQLLNQNAKVWLAAIIAAMFSWLCLHYLVPLLERHWLNAVLRVSVGGLLGLAIYAVVAWLLKIPQLLTLQNTLRRRFKI